jgi:hypothetical protein
VAALLGAGLAQPVPAGATSDSWTLTTTPGVAFSDVGCYAGGCWAANQYLGTFERYRAGGWSAVDGPTPTGGVAGDIESVSCNRVGDCWAVGTSTGTYSASNTLVEENTGSGWTIVASPNPHVASDFTDSLSGLSCAAASTCWAVGEEVDNYAWLNPVPLIEEDTGNGWEVSPSPRLPVGDAGGDLVGISCVTTGCWAVGWQTVDSTTYMPLVESETGGTWTIQPSAIPAASSDSRLTGVSCSGSDVCTAVGWTEPASEAETLPLIERSSGNGWSISPSPTVTGGGNLSAVSCYAPSACVAVGGAGYVASGSLRTTTTTLIEQESRSGWSVAAASTLPGDTQPELYGVSCIGQGDCVAAGSALLPVPGTSGSSGGTVVAFYERNFELASVSMTVAADTSTITPGHTVTLTAHGLPADATGSLSFEAGDAPLCSAAVSHGGASCTTSPLALGTYMVTATYAGDLTDRSATASTQLTVAASRPSSTRSGGPLLLLLLLVLGIGLILTAVYLLLHRRPPPLAGEHRARESHAPGAALATSEPGRALTEPELGPTAGELDPEPAPDDSELGDTPAVP